jgi:hypothetical protein
MPRKQPLSARLATASRWPLGVALTTWRYLWRTTPLHRDEVEGSLERDSPPAHLESASQFASQWAGRPGQAADQA